MAKIKTLTGNPADFPLPIKVHELDGTEAEIILTFKGRTLRDWHPIAVKQMTDDANNLLAAENAQQEARESSEAGANGAESAADEEAKRKPRKKSEKLKPMEFDPAAVEETMKTGLKRSTDVIRLLANGWDLDIEFSDANIELLCTTYPGVHQTAWAEYDRRIRGNRLGN